MFNKLQISLMAILISPLFICKYFGSSGLRSAFRSSISTVHRPSLNRNREISAEWTKAPEKTKGPLPV